MLLYYKILIDIGLLWTRPIQRTPFAQSPAMFNTLLAIAKLIEFFGGIEQHENELSGHDFVKGKITHQ